MEIRVGGFDRDTNIITGGRACGPDVTALIYRIWIETNIHFQVTSCNDSPEHPVVHRIQHELGSLPGVASHGELQVLIHSQIEESTAVVDNISDVELVARILRIVDIDTDEVPAGVAVTSVNINDAELALADVESAVGVVDANGHTSVDVVIVVKLAGLLVHHRRVLVSLEV